MSTDGAVSHIINARMPKRRAGRESARVHWPEGWDLLPQRQDAGLRLTAAGFVESLFAAAKILEHQRAPMSAGQSRRAQIATVECVGVPRSEVWALLLQRKEARSRLGAVDLVDRLPITAKVLEHHRA